MTSVRIEMLNDEEWLFFKDAGSSEDSWAQAVKEVCELNASGMKYRAIVDCNGLTHIYASGFYTVPTVRFY